MRERPVCTTGDDRRERKLWKARFADRALDLPGHVDLGAADHAPSREPPVDRFEDV